MVNIFNSNKLNTTTVAYKTQYIWRLARLMSDIMKIYLGYVWYKLRLFLRCFSMESIDFLFKNKDFQNKN